jgi:protein-disulfide isomerase
MWGGIAALVGAGGAALAMGAASAPVVGTTDRAAIEAIVRDYILAHPEILPEAMRNLEARDAAKVVAANRTAIETPFDGAWEGAAKGDVTLVEFFDYNCGYCRASLPVVQQLLAEDKGLRVVYREVPILGEASVEAARHSLAVAQLGGYMAFHRALFAAGHSTPTSIGAALAKAGANTAAVKAAINAPAIAAEINGNIELQRKLNMNGTPGWVVGDRVINGAVGYGELKAAIAAARARKG